MGDGDEVWCHLEGATPERQRLAEQYWCGKRIAERTNLKDSVFVLRQAITATKLNLSDTRAKLALALAGREA